MHTHPGSCHSFQDAPTREEVVFSPPLEKEDIPYSWPILSATGPRKRITYQSREPSGFHTICTQVSTISQTRIVIITFISLPIYSQQLVSPKPVLPLVGTTAIIL